MCGCTGASVCVEGKQVCVCVCVCFSLNPRSPKALLLSAWLFLCVVSCVCSCFYTSLCGMKVWLVLLLLFFLFCFFPPRGSEHPFYVCVNILLTLLFYPQPLQSRSLVCIHVVFFSFLHLSIRSFMCVCVCLYVNQPGGRAPEPSLWSRRWQPAAPGRNPPAGWNVGEKLSGGRIVVGRWGQEHATRASSRSFSEHHSMRRLVFLFFCFFFRESEFDHSVSRKCREDPVWWSVNRRPTGNPPSFPFRQWNVIFDTAVILQFTVCGHCGCEEGNTATIWSHHRVLCWSYVGLNIVLFFLKEEKVWGGSFSSKPQKSNLGSSSKIHEPTQLL